jgi:hypothetical protein
MGAYDRIICATARDLDAGFRKRYGAVLRPEVRGFGYFCWKPQIIHQVFQSLDQGDVLHYCDAGCHFNPAGRSRLEEYFAAAARPSSGILAFRATPLPASFGQFAGALPFPEWTNGDCCKADAMAYFGLENDASFLREPMTVATTAFFQKTLLVDDFIAKWRRAFMDDFSLIDDSPSRRPNQAGFVEHRWDQALFSCLAHLQNVETISNGEIEFPRSDLGRGDWDALLFHPIHAKRDKSISRIAKLWAGLSRRLRQLT